MEIFYYNKAKFEFRIKIDKCQAGGALKVWSLLGFSQSPIRK
jgi:hypothetical protein